MVCVLPGPCLHPSPRHHWAQREVYPLPGSIPSVSFGWELPGLGGEESSDLGTGDRLGYRSYGQRTALALFFTGCTGLNVSEYTPHEAVRTWLLAVKILWEFSATE